MNGIATTRPTGVVQPSIIGANPRASACRLLSVVSNSLPSPSASPPALVRGLSDVVLQFAAQGYGVPGRTERASAVVHRFAGSRLRLA